MSKRQEVRARQRQQRLRTRLAVIGLVIVGAALITVGLIIPGRETAIHAGQTQTAALAGVVVAPPWNYDVKVDGTHLGDPKAPVQVTIYEDFRCSGCLWYSQNIEPKIIQDYVAAGKVYYTYKVYLVIDSMDHTDASNRAANAALCAAGQNLFWPYHDTLYANQLSESAEFYTDSRLEQMAKNVGLDMKAFDQCYQARSYAADIEKSIQEMEAFNLHGTPSLFVNGKHVEDYTTVFQVIDDALANK